MAKKVNPKRIPKTEADCKRAELDGMVEGASYILVLCCDTLLSDFGFSEEQMELFNRRIDSKIESCEVGCATARDYASAMIAEHDFKLVMRNGL